ATTSAWGSSTVRPPSPRPPPSSRRGRGGLGCAPPSASRPARSCRPFSPSPPSPARWPPTPRCASGSARARRVPGAPEPARPPTARPPASVTAMAAAYLREVVALQPDGPYLFAAQSGGCYVALEMARQAAAAGRLVGGVLLMAPAIHRRRRTLSAKPSVAQE